MSVDKWYELIFSMILGFISSVLLVTNLLMEDDSLTKLFVDKDIVIGNYAIDEIEFDRGEIYKELNNEIVVKDNFYGNPSKTWKYKKYGAADVISSIVLQGSYPQFTKLTIYDQEYENSLSLTTADGSLSLTDLLQKLKDSSIDLTYLKETEMLLIPDPAFPSQWEWVQKDDGITLLTQQNGAGVSISATDETDEKSQLLTVLGSHIANGRITDSTLAGASIIVTRAYIRALLQRYAELATDEEIESFRVAYRINLEDYK